MKRTPLAVQRVVQGISCVVRSTAWSVPPGSAAGCPQSRTLPGLALRNRGMSTAVRFPTRARRSAVPPPRQAVIRSRLSAGTRTLSSQNPTQLGRIERDMHARGFDNPRPQRRRSAGAYRCSLRLSAAFTAGRTPIAAPERLIRMRLAPLGDGGVAAGDDVHHPLVHSLLGVTRQLPAGCFERACFLRSMTEAIAGSSHFLRLESAAGRKRRGPEKPPRVGLDRTAGLTRNATPRGVPAWLEDQKVTVGAGRFQGHVVVQPRLILAEQQRHRPGAARPGPAHRWRPKQTRPMNCATDCPMPSLTTCVGRWCTLERREARVP